MDGGGDAESASHEKQSVIWPFARCGLFLVFVLFQTANTAKLFFWDYLFAGVFMLFALSSMLSRGYRFPRLAALAMFWACSLVATVVAAGPAGGGFDVFGAADSVYHIKYDGKAAIDVAVVAAAMQASIRQSAGVTRRPGDSGRQLVNYDIDTQLHTRVVGSSSYPSCRRRCYFATGVCSWSP